MCRSMPHFHCRTPFASDPNVLNEVSDCVWASGKQGRLWKARSMTSLSDGFSGDRSALWLIQSKTLLLGDWVNGKNLLIWLKRRLLKMVKRTASVLKKAFQSV